MEKFFKVVTLTRWDIFLCIIPQWIIANQMSWMQFDTTHRLIQRQQLAILHVVIYSYKLGIMKFKEVFNQLQLDYFPVFNIRRILSWHYERSWFQ